MENRFKFRGKRVDNGEWTYGFLSFIYVKGRNQNGFIYTDKAVIYCQDDCCNYDVYTESLGQCIGKRDKNGKLIYDGDIVKTNWDNPSFAKVVYSVELCCFGIEWLGTLHPDDIGFKPLVGEGYIESELQWDLNKFFVEGNIHENSELIEGVIQ